MLDGEVHSTIRVALELVERAGCSHRGTRQVGRPRERILTSPLVHQTKGVLAVLFRTQSSEIAVHVFVSNAVGVRPFKDVGLRVLACHPDVPAPHDPVTVACGDHRVAFLAVCKLDHDNTFVSVS